MLFRDILYRNTTECQPWEVNMINNEQAAGHAIVMNLTIPFYGQ